jgi:hypothetical protein
LPVVLVACGWYYTMMLTGGGCVWTCCLNNSGQLGHCDWTGKHLFMRVDPGRFGGASCDETEPHCPLCRTVCGTTPQHGTLIKTGFIRVTQPFCTNVPDISPNLTLSPDLQICISRSTDLYRYSLETHQQTLVLLLSNRCCPLHVVASRILRRLNSMVPNPIPSGLRRQNLS